MRHVGVQRRQPLEFVAAGVVYLALSSILFVFWLSVNHLLVLALAVSTVVAGLVDLSVGWPRLRAGRDNGMHEDGQAMRTGTTRGTRRR